MREVFLKLRVYCRICWFRLKLFWFQITMPFRLVAKSFERYRLLRKIDKESEDRWERHLKLAELKRKDELELRRGQFFLEKVRVIGAFFRTSCCASCCVQSQQAQHSQAEREHHDVIESSREEFQKNKGELIATIQTLEGYEEITFDEEIKSEILAWEFEQFKTQDDLNIWSHRFSDYICTLDII